MLLFLLDIIVISVLILSFAAFVFLYINPNYTVNLFKKAVVQQTCAIDKKKKGTTTGMEVYNVSQNIYTYQQAENVCKELRGTLATKKQLDEAFKKGASWCNYGWTKGQSAYFPIQGSFYSELQKDSSLREACGTIGVNGGYFKDPYLKFGVNCYGIKPPQEPSDKQYSTVLDMVIPTSERSQHRATREPILKFNMKQWSSVSAPRSRHS